MSLSPSTPSQVHAHHADGVAVLTLDNPPVNGLGDTARRALMAALQTALDDAQVCAIVIHGAGANFCGGSDIRQFGTPAATAKPTLREVILAIESSTKPVVAAIHGVALGGGLELALGCHYRIAHAEARLGLPETSLGVVPGAGGTQRLPRLVGVARALDMIQHARQIDARQALHDGLVDAVADTDLVAIATQYARTRAADGAPRVTGRLPVRIDTEIDVAAASDAVSRRASNAGAQRAAIDCVAAATRLPLEAGLDYERAQFDTCVHSTESQALRHLFFAQRRSAKPVGAVERTIQHVGILGAGTMGSGIAMAFANAGYAVTLFDREAQALARGEATMRRNYEISAAKGKLTAAQIEERLARIDTTMTFDALASADLVIEAVFEDMAVKQDIFRRLDALCKPGAILATNTSRLDVDTIAAVTSRPRDVIGLHFFSPANVMKLLEIVRGARTHADVIATCLAMARRIGKIAVVVGVCEGFVGNRMLTGYWREAGFLLEEGASPQQVDRALTRFGMAMGPLTMADLAGMDINWATRKRLAPTRPAHLRYSRVADRICEQGRFGQKTLAGYYRYEPDSRTPLPDPVVDAIIDDCAREAGIVRRAVTDEEIVERCMLALVNEGARIVEEGIASCAADVDLVYVNGYGFPAQRGGPMFYAQTLGLAHTLTRLKALEREHGEIWRPAPLLERLVAAGETRFA